jgi:hypothetical protein
MYTLILGYSLYILLHPVLLDLIFLLYLVCITQDIPGHTSARFLFLRCT